MKRIQRKRTKGWKMPSNAVYVGRPTKWGNPWRVGQGMSAQEAVNQYREYAKQLDIKPLRGKDLACWCPLDAPCHADVLIKLIESQGALS